MRKICILILALAACACARTACLDGGDTLVLDGKWDLSRDGGSERLATTVPSTVAGSLHAAGFLGEDLLEGRNYEKADKSIFDDTWTYTTAFSARPAKGGHAELVFDGLNYYADVFLNGKQIASSDTTSGVFTFIHAATHSGVTISRSTEPYYAPRYLTARRILH